MAAEWDWLNRTGDADSETKLINRTVEIRSSWASRREKVVGDGCVGLLEGAAVGVRLELLQLRVPVLPSGGRHAKTLAVCLRQAGAPPTTSKLSSKAKRHTRDTLLDQPTQTIPSSAQLFPINPKRFEYLKIAGEPRRAMGLVQYDSSDEDEEVQTPVKPQVSISLISSAIQPC